MPLTAAELLAPNGDIELAYFPSEAKDSVEKRIDTWLNEGYTLAPTLEDTVRDDIARHYAYHKAYMVVFRRLNANPASWSAADSGGHSFTAEQIRNFLTLAETERGAYEALIPVVVVGTGSSQLPPTLVTRSRVELFGA